MADTLASINTEPSSQIVHFCEIVFSCQNGRFSRLHELLNLPPKSPCISFWFLTKKAATAVVSYSNNHPPILPRKLYIFCNLLLREGEVCTQDGVSLPHHNANMNARSQEWNILLRNHQPVVDRDNSDGTAARYRLDEPGIESQYGERFSAPIQTDPWCAPSLLYKG